MLGGVVRLRDKEEAWVAFEGLRALSTPGPSAGLASRPQPDRELMKLCALLRYSPFQGPAVL
jgi:hypothetical protein